MDMTTFVLAKNYADKQIEKAEMGDIELDNTLTKQGFAADAKAVGDKLNSIKIPAIDSTLSVEGAAADAKAVGEALKNIDTPEQVQVDWEQVDETASDFVKNKPCYVIYQDTDNSSTYVARDFRTPYRESQYYTPLNDLYNSQLCKVIFDGVEYFLKNQAYGEWRLALGDATFAEYPFYLTSENNMDEETRIYSADNTVLHSIQVSEVEANVKTLDPILIPKSIARLDDLSPDWEQKDPTASDYIQNRPFYDNSSSILMGSQYVHFVSDMSGEGYEPIVIQNTAKIQMKNNDTVIISLNGAKFKCLINMIQHGETDEWGDIIGPITYTYETSILGFRFVFDNDNYTITIISDKSWYGNIGVFFEQQDLKQIDPKFLPIKNGDWNQTDPTKPDFIHNKPFYLKTKGQTILEKQEVSFLAEDYSPYYPTPVLTETTVHLNNSDKVVIVIDGVEYESVVEERLNEDTWEYDYIAICEDYSFTFRQNYEGIFSINIEYLQEGEMGGSSHTATIEIYDYDFELKKINNQFIDSAEELSVEDIRPIQNSTVTKAINVLTQKIEGGAQASQTNWDQLDSTQSDFILNKPFGITPKTTYCNTSISYHEEWDEDGMDSQLIWDNNLVGGLFGASQPSGTIAVVLGDRMEIAQHTNEWNSGTLQTSFITIEWNYNRWSVAEPLSFTITSAPTDDLENPCKLVIMQVEVKKIDNTYIDFPQSNWNEADETSPSYIQNRTHHDEGFGENEQIVYKLGDYSYDDMGERQYEKFTEAEINTSIGNYMYIFKTTTSTWNPEEDLYMSDGESIRSYYYDDGMNSGYAITYNGVEYKDYIDTIIFSDGITGLEISRTEVISELKQLDEKFIPDTIARATELEALISDMYYKPGDSISVRITTGGVLTAGGETVWFTIPLCKPRKNIQSVSVNADYSCLIRQDGNYLLGSATEYAQASSIGFDLSSPDFILANLKFDTVPEGAVNNDTVGVTFYATLTFA